MENKNILRRQSLDLRNSLSNEARKILNSHINNSIWDLIISKNVTILHSYLPMGSEVNVFPTLEKALKNGIILITSKTLPNRQLQHLIVTDLNNMENGKFGTKYPKNTEIYSGKLDMILVPGVSFDKAGNRIGYGAGYYDSFLAENLSSSKIGVCFPCQMVESIDSEVHDIKMDLIVFG